jgi:pimeloyl-ACP methyl ester carboxylesterase
MSDLSPDEIQAEAEALVDRLLTPKRRVRPRLAEPLRDADDMQVETPFGPVMAWRLGKGPAVLLVHGWDDDNCLWGPLIDKFVDMRRAVVVLDLPGHGFSPAEDPSPIAAAAAVRAVAAALGPVDAIVSHSFGCPASILAMADGLAIGRAALIATPKFKSGHFWTRLEGMGISPDVIERAKIIHAARIAERPAAPDIEEAAGRMTAKALLVHSLDDEECPPANSRALKAAWPGAKLALTDGLGHRLVAQDPATLDRIVNFIEGFEK